MNVMERKQKMLDVIKAGGKHKIVVTHVTIRQSIFFLLLKLLVLEAFAAGSVIVFHTILISAIIKNPSGIIGSFFTVFNVPLFTILVLIKSFLMVFVIIMWIEEYYEITTVEVVHKKGLIFKKEERFSLDHLGKLRIEQGVFGRVFNYGTVKLYDWILEKEMVLYLIHNPLKYHHILENLLPDADREKQILREKIVEFEE